jgi:hypothetical protein
MNALPLRLTQRGTFSTKSPPAESRKILYRFRTPLSSLCDVAEKVLAGAVVDRRFFRGQNTQRGETADLPVEQPVKFELVINLKTAKAIGVQLSTAIQIRARRVDRVNVSQCGNCRRVAASNSVSASRM